MTITERKEILTRIINKGGLMALCAKKYVHDEEQTDLFIQECAQQCHNNSALKLWGEDLVNDIKNYSDSKNLKKLNLSVPKKTVLM